MKKKNRFEISFLAFILLITITSCTTLPQKLKLEPVKVTAEDFICNQRTLKYYDEYRGIVITDAYLMDVYSSIGLRIGLRSDEMYKNWYTIIFKDSPLGKIGCTYYYALAPPKIGKVVKRYSMGSKIVIYGQTRKSTHGTCLLDISKIELASRTKEEVMSEILGCTRQKAKLKEEKIKSNKPSENNFYDAAIREIDEKIKVLKEEYQKIPD